MGTPRSRRRPEKNWDAYIADLETEFASANHESQHYGENALVSAMSISRAAQKAKEKLTVAKDDAEVKLWMTRQKKLQIFESMIKLVTRTRSPKTRPGIPGEWAAHQSFLQAEPVVDIKTSPYFTVTMLEVAAELTFGLETHKDLLSSGIGLRDLENGGVKSEDMADTQVALLRQAVTSILRDEKAATSQVVSRLLKGLASTMHRDLGRPAQSECYDMAVMLADEEFSEWFSHPDPEELKSCKTSWLEHVLGHASMTVTADKATLAQLVK